MSRPAKGRKAGRRVRREPSRRSPKAIPRTPAPKGLKSAPRTPDYLTELTGFDATHWFRRVQALIADHSTAPRGPLHNRHGRTNVAGWLPALHREVLKATPKGNYDGNMRHAAALGLILSQWFLRVQKAKAYDPRRPIRLRQMGQLRWQTHVIELMAAAIDESQDPFWFGAQHFDPPFGRHAIDGVFT